MKTRDVHKKRYRFDSARIETRDFVREHEARDWKNFVMDVLRLAGTLTPEWIVTRDGHESVSGMVDPTLNEKKGRESPRSGPSG